jgi:hypothetical protein
MQRMHDFCHHCYSCAILRRGGLFGIFQYESIPPNNNDENMLLSKSIINIKDINTSTPSCNILIHTFPSGKTELRFLKRRITKFNENDDNICIVDWYTSAIENKVMYKAVTK